MDLSLGLEGTHAIITGAAGHIGRVVAQAFLAAGSHVSAFDIKQPEEPLDHDRIMWYSVDVTEETAVESAFEQSIKQWGTPATCIAIAGLDLSYLPHHWSLSEMGLEQWQRTNKVNGDGTFLTARTWLRCLIKNTNPELRNTSLVIFGSEAGVFGVTGNADYASSKAGIQYGLMKSLMRDVVAINNNARVNAIAPGAVHTKQFDKECAENQNQCWVESQATVAMAKPVPLEQVAKCCLFLASENWSGSITGQVIQVDCGKTGRFFWGRDGELM